MQEKYEMQGEVRTLLRIKHTNLTDLMYLCHHGSAQTTSWQVQLKSKTSVELLTSTNIILNGLSITEAGRNIISANERWHKTKAGWFCSGCQAQHFLFLQHISSTVFIMHTNHSFILSLSQRAILNVSVLLIITTAACKKKKILKYIDIYILLLIISVF